MNSILAKTPTNVKRRKDQPAVLTGKMTISKPRIRYERTTLMTWDRATAFLKAMATRSDIDDLSVCRDRHTTVETHADFRFYVRFVRLCSPTNTCYSLQTMQDTRTQRACDQRTEMQFVPTLDKADWHFVIHTYPDAEGCCAIYETHVTQGCTCPDFGFRCVETGLLCKHQVALAAFLPPVAPVEVRTQVQQAIEKIKADSAQRDGETRAQCRDRSNEGWY